MENTQHEKALIEHLRSFLSTLENVHLRKAFTMIKFLSNPSLIIAWLRSHPLTISGFGPLIDVTLNDEYAIFLFGR